MVRFLLFVEVLYVPFIDIYAEYLDKNIICCMNFLWYSFISIYFLIFIYSFVKLFGQVLSIRYIDDIRKNCGIIKRINQDFKRKSFYEKKNVPPIDLLINDIKHIGVEISIDNDVRLQNGYLDLIYDICNEYLRSKEFSKKSKGKRWIRRSNRLNNEEIRNREYLLLWNLLHGNYFELHEDMLCYISSFIMELVQRNINIQANETCTDEALKRKIYKERDFARDYNKWIELIKIIFERIGTEKKKDVLHSLDKGCRFEGQYANYCEGCIEELIGDALRAVSTGKLDEDIYLEVFGGIMLDPDVNEMYCNSLISLILSNNSFNAVKLVKLLNEQNAIIVFTYIIIYYSIYKSREDWNYINVDVMASLWNNGEKIEDALPAIIDYMKKSWISHRVSPEMCEDFSTYLNSPLDRELLNNIYEKRDIDIFYLIVVKVCVLKQTYNTGNNTCSDDIYTYFINELVKHGELMSREEIKMTVIKMRREYFRYLRKIPNEFKDSLRKLLLADMKLTYSNFDGSVEYLYYESMGRYALLKEYATIGKNKWTGVIRKAYERSNMSIDEYVNNIEKECDICGESLNYIQKEKMRRYLIYII